MTDQTCRFVTLAVTTVDAIPSTAPAWPRLRPLAAIAMLVADRDRDSEWTFDLLSRAVGAGDGEDRLLAWATDALPDTGIAIGWKLADDVVAPLLEAARDGDPDICAAFLRQLTALVTLPSVDLSIPHGGAGAGSLASVAARHDIKVNDMAADEIMTAWSFGETNRLAADAAARAIAAWEFWLAEANGTATQASDAWEVWRRR